MRILSFTCCVFGAYLVPGSCPTNVCRQTFKSLLPGKLCQSTDFFGIVIIFTISLQRHRFFKILTLSDQEFNFVYVSSFITWLFRQFLHFSSVFRIHNGHFVKSGELSTKFKVEKPGRASLFFDASATDKFPERLIQKTSICLVIYKCSENKFYICKQNFVES